MIVTAWNNGTHHSNGAGYGFKIDTTDRDKHFKKEWKNVILEFDGETKQAVVNVEKQSFWGSTCRELICKEIGIWLIKNRKAPWPKNHPPKMKIEHIYENIFKVKLIQNP